jgi:hypothetical protein
MGRKKEYEDNPDNEYEEEEKIYPEIYPTIEKSAPSVQTYSTYPTYPTAPVSGGANNPMNPMNPNNPINPMNPNNPMNPINRINEFLLEKKKLEEKLSHYKKIKKRWTKADSAIKITCMSLAGIITIATSVIGGLTPAILGATAGIITGVMGGVGGVQLFLGEGVSIGVTSKKKKIYREICEQVEYGINKLYLFQVKALEDKVLSTEEIEECQRIITEINGKIEGLKDRKTKKI